MPMTLSVSWSRLLRVAATKMTAFVVESADARLSSVIGWFCHCDRWSHAHSLALLDYLESFMSKPALRDKITMRFVVFDGQHRVLFRLRGASPTTLEHVRVDSQAAIPKSVSSRSLYITMERMHY